MIKVRQHKRKKKNGVTIIKRHQRGKYGLKPVNDKYPPRDTSNMDLAKLEKHYARYQAEFTKLMSGQLFSSDQHKSFIARRLQNVKRAIITKKKKISDTN